MSGRAHASLDVITSFKNKNEELYNNLYSYSMDLNQAIKALESQANSKKDAYDKMKSKLDALLSKAHNKRSQASSALSSAKSNLSSTPKTIEKTTTNSNGETTTKKVANPAYAAAQGAVQAASANLASIDKIISNIKAAKTNIDGVIRQISMLQNSLKNAKQTADIDVERLCYDMNVATMNINKVYFVVDKYTSIKIR